MSSASPRSQPTANLELTASPLERRLGSEWDLLRRLADRNPHRLVDLAAEDLTFRLRLLGTPGLPLKRDHITGEERAVSEHEVVLTFPRFFPAAPLELYLTTPMQHPNIHPETGFVCLWDRHRVSHTVEHALHKLVAMLGWMLYNRAAVHVMQPEALARMDQSGVAISASLTAPPLLGVVHDDLSPARAMAERDHAPRRRLS